MAVIDARHSTCPGCSVVLPDEVGPTHPYLGASPACWRRYGEVLARELGELRYPPYHRLTVDAYAVQHPGVPERRSIQSVAIHLMSLCLVLEQGVAPERATKQMGVILSRSPTFWWLEPPRPNGSLTVLDLLDARNANDHRERVWRWARDLWATWSEHHASVHRWLADSHE